MPVALHIRHELKTTYLSCWFPGRQGTGKDPHNRHAHSCYELHQSLHSPHAILHKF